MALETKDVRSYKPQGSIRIGDQVRIGDGAVIENSVSSDLIIPHNSTIPTRSYVINDGEGTPKFVS